MSLACIHTHTVFCDGADDVETCCRAAFDKGLSSIGFSAHAPVKRKTGFRTSWHLSEDSLEAYIETVRHAQKRWKGKLPVYLGLEVDFVPGLMGPADADYHEMDLDFIIGSVHYVIPPRGEPFGVDDTAANEERGIKECFGGDAMGMVEAYYDSLAAMIHAGSFDVLGHPDLVKKNNSGAKFFSEDNDVYRQKTAVIAALMAGKNIPAEVNTGGMNRGKIKDCYPSLAFLELFRGHGVPMVINADAHSAKDLDGHYDDARRTMLDAGYTETALFNGRKNGRPVWKSEPLS